MVFIDHTLEWCRGEIFEGRMYFLFGLALFLFLDSANWKGIGLGIVLLGFSIIFLDHFSEERANVYHQKIVEKISKG